MPCTMGGGPCGPPHLTSSPAPSAPGWCHRAGPASTHVPPMVRPSDARAGEDVHGRHRCPRRQLALEDLERLGTCTDEPTCTNAAHHWPETLLREELAEVVSRPAASPGSTRALSPDPRDRRVKDWVPPGPRSPRVASDRVRWVQSVGFSRRRASSRRESPGEGRTRACPAGKVTGAGGYRRASVGPVCVL